MAAKLAAWQAAQYNISWRHLAGRNIIRLAYLLSAALYRGGVTAAIPSRWQPAISWHVAKSQPASVSAGCGLKLYCPLPSACPAFIENIS